MKHKSRQGIKELAVAQQIAGHSNIKTTLDHYYIPDAENVKQATDELAKNGQVKVNPTL